MNRLLLLLLLVMFCIPLLAQSTGDANGGVISGTVVDSTGRPIAGACVQLSPLNTLWSGVVRLHCTDTGHFQIPVRLGTYDVNFFAPSVHFRVAPKRVALTHDRPAQNLILPLVPTKRN